jgi:hypothetical protein
MKQLIAPVLAAAFTFTVTSTIAAEHDCSTQAATEYAICKDNQTLVKAYRAELIASADGALKEGLRNRIPHIDFSIDQQASSIRQLVSDGRLSPRTLALIN